MDDLINLLEGFIKMSSAKQKPITKSPDDFTKWKQSAALPKLGWLATTCEKDVSTGDLIVTWHKDGKEDIKIALSFIEQQLWLEYLDKEKTDDK